MSRTRLEYFREGDLPFVDKHVPDAAGGRRAQPHDRHPRAPRPNAGHRVRDRRSPTPTPNQTSQLTSARQKRDRLLRDRHSGGTAGGGVTPFFVLSLCLSPLPLPFPLCACLVGTNRVRRQILCDETSAEVLLARVTDVHVEPPFILWAGTCQAVPALTLWRRWRLTHSWLCGSEIGSGVLDL